MSSAGDGEGDSVAADEVVLEITDALSLSTTSAPPPPPILVSALAAPLPSPTVAVRGDRSRLIESSSYFHALLGGSFRSASSTSEPPELTGRLISQASELDFSDGCSESGSGYVRISCDLDAAVQVLRYLFEPPASFAITHENFLPLLEGALFLAVENVLVDCERWFRTMRSQCSSVLVAPLDFIIEAWYFALKHGVTSVEDICPGYLAQNFVGT